jgi:hypothetical protein
VNTSLTWIALDHNSINRTNRASIDALVARNARFRHLFLFDVRQMLLSAMTGCADECGVVWPYLLNDDDMKVGVATVDVETLRAEFATVVKERRRRAEHVVAVGADVDEYDGPAVKRRRTS